MERVWWRWRGASKRGKERRSWGWDAQGCEEQHECWTWESDNKAEDPEKEVSEERKEKKKEIEKKKWTEAEKKGKKGWNAWVLFCTYKSPQLILPYFSPKKWGEKKIQTLKHKLKCFSLWPVFPITATRTLCKLRSPRHLISFLLFTLYASSLLSFLLLCLYFAHQLR